MKFGIRRIYYTLIEINNGFIDGRENKGRNRRKEAIEPEEGKEEPTEERPTKKKPWWKFW